MQVDRDLDRQPHTKAPYPYKQQFVKDMASNHNSNNNHTRSQHPVHMDDKTDDKVGSMCIEGSNLCLEPTYSDTIISPNPACNLAGSFADSY